jgi:hypothetical protein
VTPTLSVLAVQVSVTAELVGAGAARLPGWVGGLESAVAPQVTWSCGAVAAVPDSRE